MTILSSIFGKHRDPTPPPSRPAIGVVCHRLEDQDVDTLALMRVRFVRLSLYAELLGESEARLDRAVREGYDVLCVNYRDAAQRNKDLLRWPSVQWQVGNEPDWVRVSPKDAAAAAFAGDVTPGLAHGTPREWMQGFAASYLPLSAVLAGHCYGTPLDAAVPSTVADLNAAKGSRDVWLTEIGTGQPLELKRALELLTGSTVRRAYVYALWSPDDGYSLTDAHKNVITAYITGR